MYPAFSEDSLLDIFNRLPYLTDRASRENNQKTTGALGKDVRRAIFLLHHSEDKRKVGYLAKEFNMTKPTIRETIKVLQQKMLVSKENERGNSRSYIINLTEGGK